jgi:hypothetical protein
MLLRTIKQLHLPLSHINACQDPMLALFEVDGDEDKIVQVWINW